MKLRNAFIYMVLLILLVVPVVTMSAPSIDTPPLLPDGGVGTQYTHTFISSGLTAPLTWDGSGILPPGLSVTPDGTLSGTPTSRGYYEFTVKVTDNASDTASKAVFVNISSGALIFPAAHPAKYENCTYCHYPTVPDAAPPVSTFTVIPQPFSTSSSANFSFISNETGSNFNCYLDGVPIIACISPVNLSGLSTGQHVFRVRASDSVGNVEIPPKTYTWDIHGPLVITTQSLASGTVSVPYSQTLTADGGFPPPYHWWIPNLPSGLSLNTDTGLISGAPTRAGNYTVAASVVDSIQNQVVKTFTLVIAAAAPSKIRVLESLAPYVTIAGAYGAVAAGQTIQIVADSFTENLLFDRAINFNLKGGFAADFNTNSGLTSITGTLTIAKGNVVVEKIAIR